MRVSTTERYRCSSSRRRGGKVLHKACLAAALFSLACNAPGRQEAPKTQGRGPDPESLIGTYSSVTESECNLDIELKKGGQAHTKSVCVNEDGPGEEVSESDATWAVSGSIVKIHLAGKEIPFEYVEQLLYSDFGEGGSGPGLKPVGPVGPVGPDSEHLPLSGYGSLWKTPMQTKGSRQPS